LVDPAKLPADAPANLEEIRRAIRSKYADVSVSAAGKFSYLTGREGATALRYDPAIIGRAPARIFKSSCGVGNPFSLGVIRAGESVLDIGCGGGLDMFVAAVLVGESGRVSGIDLTEDMVRRAQENLTLAGMKNVEVTKVDSDIIPHADHTFDVVISNGVINLSPRKETVFREIYRVLRSEGRLQFADVVLENELPLSIAGSAEAWSQ
jgi:arsenite methyltransferase